MNMIKILPTSGQIQQLEINQQEPSEKNNPSKLLDYPSHVDQCVMITPPMFVLKQLAFNFTKKYKINESDQ